MFLPHWLNPLLVTIGVVALILGFRRTGFGLVVPSLVQWLVLPVVAPQLGRLPLLLVALGAPVVILFAALRILQGGVNVAYGEKVGERVTSIYLVRLLDSIGRGIVWLLAAPFRLLARAFGGGR